MTKNFGNKGNTKGFREHPENINREGRPRKLVNHINEELKAEGYDPVKPDQVKDAYLTIVNLPFSRIKQMATTKSDNFPALYKIVAREMIGKRGLEMLDRLLDRAIGKATQPLDHTNKGSINLNISPDDAKL